MTRLLYNIASYLTFNSNNCFYIRSTAKLVGDVTGKKNVSAKNSFVFLRKEIPVRLANILKEIQLLPEPLLNMPSVQLVERWLVL